MKNLEQYFSKFRDNIIGIDTKFNTSYGEKKIIYADWIASGRLYSPIEKAMVKKIAPMVGNTHSEASETGTTMTLLYHEARNIIKKHVNASIHDFLITEGSGMTGALSKLQRILGLKIPEQAGKYTITLTDEEKPVVFITHMEHHSNHTSWLETIADVVVLEPTEDIKTCPENLKRELKKYENRKLKIGSFSAGSNVTGIVPKYHELAEIMHQNGGLAFIDFAASFPYVDINMHPENKMQYLDALFFSPHKALGGPGSAGVLIFNEKLYKNKAPDNPGGGTVAWTNRWNEYAYVDDIEAREDGGTPAFLQTIRIAYAIKLKEKMGVKNILDREHELLEIAFEEFDKIPEIHILANKQRDRLGVISFFIENIHHNLIVRLLNDLYGIQVRGGCSCAGTYGHYLLQVSKDESHRIADKINHGDLSDKPGWVRLSIHPTMTNKELYYIIDAIKNIINNIKNVEKDYYFDKKTGEFFHKKTTRLTAKDFNDWFTL